MICFQQITTNDIICLENLYWTDFLVTFIASVVHSILNLCLRGNYFLSISGTCNLIRCHNHLYLFFNSVFSPLLLAP
jgi:hypothetical protein